MAEFNEILKKLMEKNGINAEQLHNSLDVSSKISANTIRNYINGDTKPNCYEYYKILADFFNVSTDYIQGYTEEPSTDIKIKEICNTYGLKENSLLALINLNSQKKDFNRKMIDTVNYLLEDVFINKQNSIINVITDYLYCTKDIKEFKIPLKYDSETGVTEVLTIEGSTAIKSILLKEIEDKLNWLKGEIRKEGEKDECKRTRKK